MYPPYCVLCGSKANWNSDFDCEDYGFDVEGIVGVYTCCECGITQFVIDAFLEDSQPRIIKYETQFLDEEEFEEEESHCDVDLYVGMIKNCLFCSGGLEENSVVPVDIQDVLVLDGPIESGVKTVLTCRECDCKYRVLDVTTGDELYSKDDAECIFYTRSVYVE